MGLLSLWKEEPLRCFASCSPHLKLSWVSIKYQNHGTLQLFQRKYWIRILLAPVKIEANKIEIQSRDSVAKEDTHTHNEMLFSHKKEWNDVICSNMDATRDYHIKRQK